MPMKEDRRGWGSATGGSSGLRLGPEDYFKPGAWNARDWNTGRKCKSDEMVKLSIYDGNGWVRNSRSSSFDITNPQQFVRGIPDRPNVPWTQPTPPPIFASGGATPSSQVKARTFMFGGRLFGGQLLG